MLKFLVDECVGPTVARWLRESGYDALSIYDGVPGIQDDMVLDQAVREGRVLITSDKDFGEMIFKNRNQHCGVLLLRLIDERPASKIQVLKNLLKSYEQDLFGNFVVATEQTVRIIKPFLS